MPTENSKAIDWHSFGLHEHEDGSVNLEMPLGENSPHIECNWMCSIKNGKVHKQQRKRTHATSDPLNQNEFEWGAKLPKSPGNNPHPLAFFAKLDHFFNRFDRLSLLLSRFSLFLFVGLCFGLSLYSFVSEIHEHRYEIRHNLFDQCSHKSILIQHTINQSLIKVEMAQSLITTFYENHDTPQITQASFSELLNQFVIGLQHVSMVSFIERVPQEYPFNFSRKNKSDLFMNGAYSMENTSSYTAPIVFSYTSSMNPYAPNPVDPNRVAAFRTLASRVNGSQAFYLCTLKYPSMVRIAVLLPIFSYNQSGSSPNSLLGWIFSEINIQEIASQIQNELSNDRCISDTWLYDLTNPENPITLYDSTKSETSVSASTIKEKIKGEQSLDVYVADTNTKYVLRCSSGRIHFPWRALTWLAALIFMLCGFYGLFYLITVKRKIHELSESFETMRYLRDHAQKAKQAAENADASKSQFLATISHEIRTPLNGVIGMLSLLRETKLDATQLDYVQTAVSSGKALISLINDVLDFSKIEAGKMEIENAAFDLRAEVEDVVVLFAETTRTKGIELGVLIQHSLPSVLVGDSARFRQVLINLIGNATKFTDEGHILVSIFQLDDEENLETMHKSFGGFQSDLKTTCSSPYAWRQTEGDAHLNGNANCISNGFVTTRNPANKYSNSKSSNRYSIDDIFHTDEEEKHINIDQMYETLSGCLTASSLNTYEKVAKWMVKPLILSSDKTIRLAVSVEDTGQGVPLNAQERIFQPFKQADSGTFRRAGGTGIGLNISKRLVELMGGKLNFVSTPSIGSTFFFDIQFKLNDDPEQANHARLIRGDSVRGQSIIIQSGLNHTCSVETSQKQKLVGNHVLIIDSLPLRAKILAYHLRSMGITCDFAQSASRAMELLKEFQPERSKLAHATSLSQATFKSNLSGFDFQAHLEDLKRPGSGSLCRTSSGSIKFDEGSVSYVQSERQHQSSNKRLKYSAVFVDADSSLWDNRGLEFGKMARRSLDPNEIPLILMSQKLDSAFNRSALKSGYSSVLPKPLRRASISFALSKALKIDLDQGNSESKKQNSEILTHLLKGRRIMCVDDNLVNRRVASKMLSKYGVETLCIEGGNEAVEYIQEHIEIDLILMDIQMPEMDGYEAARKIREFENQVNASDPKRNVYNPIVAMTADVLKGTREKCLAAGMDGYLTKPIDPSELSRTVAKFFSSKSNASIDFM